MKLLKGFNSWQRRITLLTIISALFTVIGFLANWYPLAIIGGTLILACIPVLILLGNRQNWRQLKHVQTKVDQLIVTQRPHGTGKKNPTLSLPVLGVSHEYAHRIQRRPAHFETFALMSKSLNIRDAFALAATDFRLQDKELQQFIGVQRMNMLPKIRPSDLKQWNPQAFLALARLRANQRATEMDLEDAVRMFAFAEAMFGLKSLKQLDRLIYLEALGELEDFAQQDAHAKRFRLATILPVQKALLQLNAIQATITADSDDWVKQLNSIYLERGFAPVKMTNDPELAPLDRLRSQRTVEKGGPLVSVIVPTYEGGPLLLTALRSLLNQSWENIEIIVVDDSSGPENNQYLAAAQKLSPKIRILKQEENLGAYAARNRGVANASGDYVTVHDDDDWSHTDKIATQVRHLVNNPDVPGNLSAHTRVTDDLKFLRINNNPILTQANYSSLMVHRSVFEQVGDWDPVNRGGDSEFRARIKKFFGTPVQTLDFVPLSFTRTREGSLTAGELSRGFLDPVRVLYSKAYTQWHDEVGNNLDLLAPREPRSFPVPTTMLPGSKNTNLGAFDIVFMTDYRFPGGTSSLTLKEIEASYAAGYRVGYIQADSPLNASSSPIAPQLFALQLQGKVEQIGLQDFADIRLLVIRHPSVATYMDGFSSSLGVRKAVLIVNNPPVLVGGAGMVFDLPTSLENIDRIFSTRSMIVAESGVTWNLCRGLISSSRLLDMTWPGLIHLMPEPNPNFSEPPIVGRHSRDDTLKWPSTETEFNQAYTSAGYITKFLGGSHALVKKLGKEAALNKIIYGFGELDVDEFLESIDFWVYFHDNKLTESFGMAIAEAMAAGKVVILPHYLEASFGTGAIYAVPSEVETIVLELWNEPTRYFAQSRRAREYVNQHFSLKAFLTRINKLTQALSIESSKK